jgi:hypothetical protein
VPHVARLKTPHLPRRSETPRLYTLQNLLATAVKDLQEGNVGVDLPACQKRNITTEWFR